MRRDGAVAMLALAWAIVGAAAPAAAQRLCSARFAPASVVAAPTLRVRALPADSLRQADWPGVAAGAAVGGLLGAGVGAYTGYYLSGGDRLCGDDTCGFVGGVLGFFIGEPVGMALGAHVVNRRRGNVVLDALGAAASGYLLAYAGEVSDQGWMLPVAGILQVATTVGVERASAAARRRRPRP